MTQEKPHPIQLERVMFIRCSVVAIPSHAPGPDATTAPPTNQINVVRADDSEARRYVATMRTTVNPNAEVTSPYSIDMECVGFLTADETLDDAEAKRGVTITAHSVLYGAIREAVAWITGRQPYGQLMLGLSVLKPANNPPASDRLEPTKG